MANGLNVLNGGDISHQIAPYHEANNITVNTVNDTVYVEDLHRPITIIKDRQRVTVDQFTGFAYVSNSGDNTVSVFRSGQPVTTIELPAGLGYKPW